MVEPEFMGRLAIVTGASRGIGEAIARRLARGGATVVISARTLHPTEGASGSLTEVADDINRTASASGGRAIAIQADLSKPDDRSRLVDEASAHGPVDVLVNNAAIAFLFPGSEYPDKRARLMFEINVHAPLDLSQRVIPAMKQRRQGWIVNISSVGSVHPVGPPYAPLHSRGVYVLYGMCKAALDRMSTGLAAELHEHNVAVNSLSPWGWVPTPGTMVNDIEGMGDAAQVESPDVIAEAAAFLCAADPHRVTGRVAYSQPLLDEFKLSPVADNRRP